MANVAVLVEEFGLDVELADAIRHESLTDLEELEIEGRINLAVAITNSRYLADGEAVRLIGELELQEPLDVSNLDAVGRGRLPELVAGGLLADEAASYGSIADRPFTERERYFAKASQLTEYVKEIGLAGEDLALFFRSGRVPGEAKRVLGSDATYLASNLTRAGAIAVAKWAQMGHIVGPEVLAVLSETHTPAEYVIDLLTPSLPTIDTSDLDGILRALGDPYEPLTYVGHHRPKLPKRDGTTELLDELKRRDRVSSYKEATFGGGMRVSMRYA